MAKAMTVRIDEEQDKELLELAQYSGWNTSKSKALRVCISFTHQCFKKMPKISKGYQKNLLKELNTKFKTNLEERKLGWW